MGYNYRVITSELTMIVSIVRIGNSKGVRIPKPVLEQCEIDDAVNMRVDGKEDRLDSG